MKEKVISPQSISLKSIGLVLAKSFYQNLPNSPSTVWFRPSNIIETNRTIVKYTRSGKETCRANLEELEKAEGYKSLKFFLKDYEPSSTDYSIRVSLCLKTRNLNTMISYLKQY